MDLVSSVFRPVSPEVEDQPPLRWAPKSGIARLETRVLAHLVEIRDSGQRGCRARYAAQKSARRQRPLEQNTVITMGWEP